jgi:C4-dicarboxylate-specific signal transduction histidine kinase
MGREVGRSRPDDEGREGEKEWDFGRRRTRFTRKEEGRTKKKEVKVQGLEPPVKDHERERKRGRERGGRRGKSATRLRSLQDGERKRDFPSSSSPLSSFCDRRKGQDRVHRTTGLDWVTALIYVYAVLVFVSQGRRRRRERTTRSTLPEAGKERRGKQQERLDPQHVRRKRRRSSDSCSSDSRERERETGRVRKSPTENEGKERRKP